MCWQVLTMSIGVLTSLGRHVGQFFTRRKPNPGRKSLTEENPCALRSPKAPNFQKDDQSGASYSDLGKGRENGSEKVGNILRKLLPMISDRMTNRMYSVHCVVYVYMYGGYTFIKHDLWRREVTCALLCQLCPHDIPRPLITAKVSHFTANFSSEVNFGNFRC